MAKPDLLKFSGQDLFEYYTSQGGEYAQTLYTALSLVDDDLYSMLEKAEKENKKVALVTAYDDMDDPYTEVVIE